jgi:hypothetical protein
MGETLHVIGFPRDDGFGYQHREHEVLVPRRLEAIVERTLDVLPDRVAVGLDHLRAAREAVLGQIRLAYGGYVPAGEVLRLLGKAFCHRQRVMVPAIGSAMGRASEFSTTGC